MTPSAPFSTPAPVPSAEYRIEDLAHRSGATVRTIRAYQDRGLLPRPERRGRANVYDDSHLARLRQIAELLERGYTLASIKELLQAWDEGRGLGGVLGLVAEVDGPWTNEESGHISRSELAELFGGEQDGRAITEAVALGVLEPLRRGPASPLGRGPADPGRPGSPGESGEPGASGKPGTSEKPRTPRTPATLGTPRTAGTPGAPAGAEGTEKPEGASEQEREEEFRVPSPRELAVAAELHRAGVPLSAITAQLRELRGQVEHIAARFLDFTDEHVFIRYTGTRLSEGDASEAADLVRRLRPLAQQTVEAELARAMRKLAARNLRDHLRSATAARPPVPLPDPARDSASTPGPAPDSVSIRESAPNRVRDAANGGNGGNAARSEQVCLPAETVEAVRELVGPARVAEFVAAAAEREVRARSMDRMAAERG